MSAHWHTYKTAELAAESCSKHILSLLDEALSAETEATLAISGGSTPKLLFGYMVRAQFDWSKVHIFWVDERCVPPNDAQSNFRMADEHLLIPARIPQRNVHRVCGELPPAKAAKRYSDELREYFNLESDEVPQFDVIHLGMGADAHTASLFPGEKLIDDREGLAAAVYVEKIPQWRVTLLPSVLLGARHAVFLTAGEDKAEAVRQVQKEPYEPLKYPAQVVSRHGRRVTWFVDETAARLVS